MSKRNGMSEKEAGYLGYLAAKETNKLKAKNRKEKYYENPKLCLECKLALPYNKRYNIFCCSSCACTYNNKQRDKSVYLKISDKLKQKNKVDNQKKGIEKKVKKCKYCGSEKGKCLYPEICEKYRIFNSLIKFGFNKDVIGTQKLYGEYIRIRNLIKSEYAKHISEKELSDKYNYNSGLANFHKLLKSLNIEIRDQKTALRESYIMGISSLPEKTQYKTEWHTTWDNKEVFLRSSYEIDYANLLDEKRILYDVERLRIKYYDTQLKCYRCAIPDFYLETTNEIVEIKSLWTLDIQNMKDKYKAYIENGYKPKLILEHKETDLYSL